MGHSKSLKISIVTGALGFPRSLPLSAAGEAARQGRMVASTAAISFIHTFYVGGAVVGSFRRGPGARGIQIPLGLGTLRLKGRSRGEDFVAAAGAFWLFRVLTTQAAADSPHPE